MEIAPTRRPSVTDVEEDFDETDNVPEDGKDDDDNNTEDTLDDDTVGDDRIDKDDTTVTDGSNTENDNDDGDSDDAEDDSVDTDSDRMPEERPTSDAGGDDDGNLNKTSDPNAPVARDGLPDDDNLPSDPEVESNDPNEPEIGIDTQTGPESGPESSDEVPSDPSTSTDTGDEAIPEAGDENDTSPGSEGDDYEYPEDDDSDTGIVRENDKVKVNLLTTEATPKPTRTTTTPWPTTKGNVFAKIWKHLNLTLSTIKKLQPELFWLIMEVNLKKRMKETTMMTMVCILINHFNFIIWFLETENSDGDQTTNDEPENETETDKVEDDNETDQDGTSDENEGDVSIIEDEVKDGIPDSDDGDSDDGDSENGSDDDGDIPLIPKRSCFPFCEVHKTKKEKKPKKDKKETLWRVVARGNGLFFARMHLFTDDTFSKAWMYPPSLKTNDTIYAGVFLANGPSEATISLTR